MTSLQFERLTENIRRDGTLTSLPLTYDIAGDDRGKLVILSGNQRVDAAAAAGIDEIDILEITTRIDDDRRAAIALSHNAVVGQDDPNKLRAFYETLSLALKEYSGLTDDHFKAAAIDVATLSLRAPSFHEVMLAFPESAEIFKEALKKLDKFARRSALYAARYDDFDKFLDAVARSKTERAVINSALAVRVMAELALERLAQVETTTEPPSDE